ncbi:MAG TPA: ABC transporter permease [Humibacter sp.]|nr:ABC transporter permease [Humibacter sp.]
MSSPLGTLFRKETRQITRSRKTVAAAAMVPALMLIFVTIGDIVTLKLGFGKHPIYLLSSSHAVSGTYLLRHYTLPVLVSISALVTPSIVMGDILFGERERRTLDLLVALPISAFQVVLAKLLSVLLFAVCVTVPLFLINVLIVNAFGYASPTQTLGLLAILAAAICYSAGSALVIAFVAGEARAANIVSGLLLGPIVPLEGLILGAVHGEVAFTVCAVMLLCLAAGCLTWASRLLSFERLFGTA